MNKFDYDSLKIGVFMAAARRCLENGTRRFMKTDADLPVLLQSGLFEPAPFHEDFVKYINFSTAESRDKFLADYEWVRLTTAGKFTYSLLQRVDTLATAKVTAAQGELSAYKSRIGTKILTALEIDPAVFADATDDNE